MPAPKKKPTRSMINNRNEFVLQASQLAMQALITMPGQNKLPQGIAETSRKYAIALWRAMRYPVE